MHLPVDEIRRRSMSPEMLAVFLIDIPKMIASFVINRAIGVERSAILSRRAGEVIGGHGFIAHWLRRGLWLGNDGGRRNHVTIVSVEHQFAGFDMGVTREFGFWKCAHRILRFAILKIPPRH